MKKNIFYGPVKLFRMGWLICAICLLSGTLSAANLHLFLVGDYDAVELMPALRYDIQNVQREAKTIAACTGLKISETVLTGRAARSDHVLNKLRQLKDGPNDVILFYFTGHGFRTNSKGEDPWPNLYFAAEDAGIDYSEIIDILNHKNVRLRFLLADGCNNVVPDDAVAIVKEIVHGANLTPLMRHNYRKLFLKVSGTIVSTACKPGQVSLALSTGSLYTCALLDSLHIAVKSPTSLVNWQNIFDVAVQKSEMWASNYQQEQIPIFLIDP